ncbi:MAG TPA: sodium:proton antiporter [Burkholderiaceae bacterium]|nr:sodium:proton antiporter [Burkholderiaceae bacterium]HQR69504.1 sodium:proton antiporter [Burkholderiaceae bacterium]
MATAASAAAAGGVLESAKLSFGWAFPFAGMLLSIAMLPLLAPSFWHHHYGKVAAFWAVALLVPYAIAIGPVSAAEQVVHTVLAEYVPFLLLLVALFTATGGIYIKGNLHGSPIVNTALLAVGTGFASVMGTTGASMLMIRPLLRANDARRHRTHVVIFFIFLVANIGGALTPLGDPPLFLGFLKGVDFFWTTKAMFAPTLASVVVLLGLFFLIDTWFFNRPNENRARDPTPDSPLRLEGWINFVVFGPMILGAVLLSGVWNSGISFNVFGTELALQGIVRDLWLLVIIWASLRFTPAKVRHSNHFEWGPMIEVAKLFAGIFLTIIPVIAILRAGQSGAMAPLVGTVTNADGSPNNAMYFWATGALSSFLDNAPTYLVFFNMAGGDAEQLMGPLASTLVAISAGAVFMGANTYIGNAPNFMVRSVAVSRGVHMPSFFGYMVWSGLILLPLFGLLTTLFFK